MKPALLPIFFVSLCVVVFTLPKEGFAAEPQSRFYKIVYNEVYSKKQAVTGTLESLDGKTISGILKVDVPVMVGQGDDEIYTAKVSGRFNELNSAEGIGFSLYEKDFQGQFPRLMQMQITIEKAVTEKSSMTVDQVYGSLLCIRK